jgi:uncharacterized protein (TIGR03000 family)
MKRPLRTHRGAALALAVFVLAGGPLWAQTSSPNPGTSSGSNQYPYWGTAPESYRGPSSGSQAPGSGYSVRSGSAFSRSSGLSPLDIGLGGLPGGSYSPRRGRYLLPGPGTSSTSGYYSPAALAEAAAFTPMEPPRRGEAIAHISLRVPAGAEVWFEGQKTRQTGAVRQFVSPPLPAGRDFVYEVRVRWEKDGKPVEETRRFRVYANAEVNLDLERAAAAGLSPPQVTR